MNPLSPASRRKPNDEVPFRWHGPVHRIVRLVRRNFHANLLIKIQDALADLVPRHYVVRAEERSYLILAGEDEKEVREFYPDVRVIDREARTESGANAGPARLAWRRRTSPPNSGR